MNLNKKIKLSDVEIGKTYIVCDFLIKDIADKRLVDLGFLKGAKITLISKSFFNTTFAIKIKNSVLCIRKKQAEKIWVN